MKKLILLAGLGIWHLPGWTQQSIEGYWKNDRTGITVHIEHTVDGIRARRLDQSIWYTYSQIRSNFYRDGEGNTYFLIDDDLLEWENKTGLKKIRFQRARTTQEYQADTYTDRHQRSDIHISNQAIPAKLLQGRWINKTTGNVIQIKTIRQDLDVRTRHSGWRRYEWAGDEWRDRFGNKYYLSNGSLFYTSRSGDLIMRFESI